MTSLPATAVRKWISAYLPFFGSIYAPECDELIRSVVSPLIARCRITDPRVRAFFIRYSEKGPHVRLRLLASCSETEHPLLADIDCGWAAHCAKVTAAGDAVHGVRWEEYLPELERYGGPDAMAPVESLFEASSILALALLTPDVSSDRGFRLGRAMLVTLVTLHSLLGNRDAIRDFTQRYSSSYLALQLKTSERTTAALRGFGAAHHRQAASMQPYVAFTWTQLSHGLSLTPPLDTFSSALQRYKRSINVLLRSGRLVINGRTCNKWDVAAFPLCASIVHMNNNRLGVTIPEESFIAFALRRALDDLAD